LQSLGSQPIYKQFHNQRSAGALLWGQYCRNGNWTNYLRSCT